MSRNAPAPRDVFITGLRRALVAAPLDRRPAAAVLFSNIVRGDLPPLAATLNNLLNSDRPAARSARVFFMTIRQIAFMHMWMCLLLRGAGQGSACALT